MQLCGAKVAILIGSRLLVLRRDRKPGIDWPGMLDLPGGNLERGETIVECARREVAEEVGLVIESGQLVHRHVVQGRHGPFAGYACLLNASEVSRIRFGEEGEGWALWPPDAFVAAADAIASLRSLVSHYLESGVLPEAGHDLAATPFMPRES